jgi:rubredoxin
MARWKCKSCDGEYDDLLPDGTRYFHACPPVRDPDTGEFVPRKDPRDENVLVELDGKGVKVVKVKAEGKGRDKLKD